MDTGGLDGKRNEHMSENQSKVTAGWGVGQVGKCFMGGITRQDTGGKG